ncbi:MAG: hypothetical protein K2O18_09280 [Oscillospiraceae bacterium]|nr:hypothetical protein [Oscillospiraceae bacterium]
MIEGGGRGCCPFCTYGGVKDSKPCKRFRDDWMCFEYVPALLKNYGLELDPAWAKNHGADENPYRPLPARNGFLTPDQ